MRITGGKFKGKNLFVARGIRPTTDKVRKAIFDSLGQQIAGEVLDLFAGSGALGLEALSWGAEKADFVESMKSACLIIQKNVQLLNENLSGKTRVFCQKVEEFLSKEPSKTYDLIFADPPYEIEISKISKIIEMIGGLMKKDSVFVLEQSKRTELPERAGDLELIKSKKYGDTQVGFYQRIKKSN